MLHRVQRGELAAVHVRRDKRKGLRIQVKPRGSSPRGSCPPALWRGPPCACPRRRRPAARRRDRAQQLGVVAAGALHVVVEDPSEALLVLRAHEHPDTTPCRQATLLGGRGRPPGEAQVLGLMPAAQTCPIEGLDSRIPLAAATAPPGTRRTGNGDMVRDACRGPRPIA